MLFSIPGVENLSQTTVTIVALVLALVLVAFFGLILRRLTSGRLSLKSDRGRARQPRLGIVDVYDLDRQRQLILLRRDNVEHLLLVGGPNDVVVETNIMRAGGSRLPVTPADVQDRADPATERSVEIAPVRPVLEPIGTRSTEPVAARLGTADTMARGAIEPALKPSSVSAAPGRRPTERGVQPNGSAALPGQPGAETSRGLTGVGQPVPRPTAPEAQTGRPDMAKQLEEALARPTPEPRPAPARTLELPRATPVAQPGRLMSAFRKSEATPTPAPNGGTDATPVSTQATEPMPPSPSMPGPGEIHAEVAEAEDDATPRETVHQEPPRQELVLQQPVGQDTARQQPEREETLDDQDVEPGTVRADPVREEIAEKTETVATPASRPALTETQVRTLPRPVQASPPAAIMVPPSPQSSQAASPGRNDPFSIEDIEAEFARLLGRPVEKRDDRT